MKKIFHDILHIEGIHGLALLSREGTLLFKSFEVGCSPERDRLSWKMIISSLGDFDEVNLVYDNGRLYIRRTDNGYLVISMSSEVMISLVKLSCDIVMAELKKGKRNRGLKRFWGKKW